MKLGRKFWGAMILTISVSIIYFGTLFLRKEAITPIVTQMALGAVTLVWTAYMGTNIANKWSKGKYFQKDILEGEEK